MLDVFVIYGGGKGGTLRCLVAGGRLLPFLVGFLLSGLLLFDPGLCKSNGRIGGAVLQGSVIAPYLVELDLSLS